MLAANLGGYKSYAATLTIGEALAELIAPFILYMCDLLEQVYQASSVAPFP